jgi:hypothetical protein
MFFNLLRLNRLIRFVFVSVLSANAVAKDNGAVFTPDAGVVVKLAAGEQEVNVTIDGQKGQVEQKIVVETEHKLTITVEDYNFDGYKDFSISHLDDGMGTYSIYQVYLYSPKSERFVTLTPACGDEFINLRLVKKKRLLVNSYVDGNKWKSCNAKF